jgi:osmotically-inducible protein OsmY
VDENSNKFDSVQYAKDTWITSQIKAKIILRKGLKSADYTVVTFRNVVYIFGIGPSQEAIEHVAEIAAETMGVEKVISHVILKDAS